MPRSMIDAVGSKPRCGSEVLRVNELSTTSVDEAPRCAVAANAAAAQASDTSVTSGTISRHLLTGERLNWTPLLGDLHPIRRSARRRGWAAASAASLPPAANRRPRGGRPAEEAAAPRPG